ncbi:uncharacterized protein Eint_061100 [Encephalitozoon intestinalis ATCC 50506]|uniref:Uncharacterized protein n=1 Tax=Encephalitozoon intestinalis (strain ATCC 50506) TaxID=876142 RepID=E0S7N8_ENCIT|nr:uncharacterized protein Eint_061100 [Encephalitozoon intestinalis ATCC 50506]ADM11717.1 hypothetical protein Eint_061100 [Encephalitozoon intestinalis ATCC 50506]UTX45455.1 hypothetical protein GPK93_06g10090 [Encephalitozoon intestinalis]
MERAIELVMEELGSTHDSECIRNWYFSYLQRKESPKSKFKDVLSIIKADIEDIKVLESTVMLFEISQETADEISLKDVAHSYENSMEIISILSLYNSIFPIIQRCIRNESVGSRVSDLYNEVSMHLNGPREGSREVLEGRRRFFFDFYIPVEIYFMSVGKNYEMKEKEKKFVEMYLTKKKLDKKGLAYGDKFYEEMSCGDEKVSKALKFLFEEVY